MTRHSIFKKKVFEEAALTYNLTYQIGEFPGLHQKSNTVDISKISSSEIQSIIAKLKQTLKKYRQLTGKGRGIAAIQIGIPRKIAVIFKGKDLMTIINPEVIKKSKTRLRYPEICMSANPIIARVTRPAYIEFEYLDEAGEKQIWSDQNDRIMNRVFQHEIDHMEGIINIDLVKSSDLILLSDPQFFKNAKFEKNGAP